MSWLRENTSLLRYTALILAVLLILIFILSSYSSSYSPYGNVCMQTQSNNYISNYVLLIAAALLLFYAISGFTKRESSACKVTSTIQEIENKNVSIFSEGTKTPDTTSNENDRLAGKIEMVKKLLKEDEAKIMEIIFENEGITQDSLHFRTGFSHSKLSMIIKKLEEKDLIVRERFGRTYKIHLSKWVKNQ